MLTGALHAALAPTRDVVFDTIQTRPAASSTAVTYDKQSDD